MRCLWWRVLQVAPGLLPRPKEWLTRDLTDHLRISSHWLLVEVAQRWRDRSFCQGSAANEYIKCMHACGCGHMVYFFSESARASGFSPSFLLKLTLLHGILRPSLKNFRQINNLGKRHICSYHSFPFLEDIFWISQLSFICTSICYSFDKFQTLESYLFWNGGSIWEVCSLSLSHTHTLSLI